MIGMDVHSAYSLFSTCERILAKIKQSVKAIVQCLLNTCSMHANVITNSTMQRHREMDNTRLFVFAKKQAGGLAEQATISVCAY